MVLLLGLLCIMLLLKDIFIDKEVGMGELGVASFYTNKSVDPRWGGTMKGGVKFDEKKMTVAVLPERWKELKGKTLKVTNTKTGRTVEVEVADTGGFGKYGKSLDLSMAAFERIANLSSGVANVEWEVVGNVGKKVEGGSFSDAFSKARNAKKGVFDWGGKKYTTKLKGE